MGAAGALDGLGNQEYPTTILSQNTQHACEANTAQGNVDCDWFKVWKADAPVLPENRLICCSLPHNNTFVTSKAPKYS